MTMENILVSLFKGYADTCPIEVPLKTIISLLRDNQAVIEHTEKHRYYLEQKQVTAAAREKASCPCFAVSVRFEGGKQKANISEWTGICPVDIDHVPPERMEQCLELLKADKHTLLQYVTISGHGIRLLCRYTGLTDNCEKNHRLHTRTFTVINEYYTRLTGLECDLKCKNATRLSGLAHDEHLFFNPDAVPFSRNAETAAPKHSPASAKNKNHRRLQRVIDAACRRLADEGVEYAEHHHNEYIMRMGYLLNAYGVAQNVATQWATERFADYNGDVTGIFASCYLNIEEHGSLSLPPLRKSQNNDERQEFMASVADIEQFLNGQASFRKNTVTGKCEVLTAGSGGKYEELTDRYVNTLWCRMCKEAKPGQAAHIRAVLDSEFVDTSNPFEQYFKNLPPWDGTTDYIAQLATHVHVRNNTIPFAYYFKKWLVGMVAALFDKEVVNHEILVLTGRQGIYKTTWLNNLLSPELRRYFYLKSNARRITKDDLLTLAEFAIVCLEELDEMETQEVNQIKALTTMKVVNERAAYAHYKEHRDHIASFCGTSNNTHFLADPTGNRRWLPFEVENIDSPYDFPVDYAGVYSQAYALLQNGYHYWLEDKEIEALNLHNRHFEIPCLEQELILTHYRRPMSGEKCMFITNSQILCRINSGIRQKLSPVKIGMVLKQEGFESMRSGGKRGYRMVELTGDEIQANLYAMGRYTEKPES